MAAALPDRPRLPAHYAAWVEPGDGAAGEETLYLRSARRQIKLTGHGLGTFRDTVLPLLDGRRTLAEIEAAAVPRLPPEAVRAGLALLAERGLLEEAADDPLAEPARARLAPQLAVFHDLGLDPAEAQTRLGRATVTVLGLSGIGAAAALALAAAGVGRLRCVDHAALTPADLALTPALAGPAAPPADPARSRAPAPTAPPRASPAESLDPRVEPAAPQPGAPVRPADGRSPSGSRAEAVAVRLAGAYPDSGAEAQTAPLADDAAVAEAVAGSDFVLCALEPGAPTIYRLNRACLALGLPWSAGSANGLEGIIGPTVRPGETACHLCYTMRAVAAAEDPRDEFAYRRHLDAAGRAVSPADPPREQHVFAAGAIGHLLALEAVKSLLGLTPSALGAIVVLDLLHLTTTRHTVLRKPWCPACWPA